MKRLILVAAAVAALAFAGGASAAPTAPFGGATANPDGSITLNSATTAAGIDFSIPSGTNFGDLTQFTLSYSFTGGCPAGVPALAVMTVRGTIWIPLASVEGFSCTTGTNFSILNRGTPVDTSAILGGTAADTFGHAHSEYDNLRVLAVQLVTTGPGQTMTVTSWSLVITPGTPSPSL
jgi:hypothetical protein